MARHKLRSRRLACEASHDRLYWARVSLEHVIRKLAGTKEVLILSKEVLSALTKEIAALNKELASLQRTCGHRGQRDSKYCNFCGKQLTFDCGRESCHY